MENYEKKYKEVLELIKDNEPDENGIIHIRPFEIFPELKESDDERIRESLLEYLHTLPNHYSHSGVCAPEWIAWLEKQGEQKPADKVEPKFHKGDWTVSNLDKKTRQISEVHFDEYNSYYVVDGKSINLEEYDRLHYLWTIDDAKDGDVLSDGTTIFIFKDLLSDGSVMSYCDYDTDSGENDAFCPLSMNLRCSKITPTTKEQRDLLFAKMKEAGYEWDAEKKELKKIEHKPADESKIKPKFKTGDRVIGIVSGMPYFITEVCNDHYNTESGCIIMFCSQDNFALYEPKPTWGEEDEKILKEVISNYESAYLPPVLERERVLKELKSLKERVKPQHKEWSDVDKDILFRIIDDLKFLRDDISKDTKYAVNIVDVEREIAWLKSLRPQNTWKPSDEQINALSIVVKHGQTDDTDALKELLEQLKAL